MGADIFLAAQEAFFLSTKPDELHRALRAVSVKVTAKLHDDGSAGNVVVSAGAGRYGIVVGGEGQDFVGLLGTGDPGCHIG